MLAIGNEALHSQGCAERALELLAEAGRVVASSLDDGEVLSGLSRLLVPRFAAVCSIETLRSEEEEPRWIAAAHQDPAVDAHLQERLRARVRPTPTSLVGRVLVRGQIEASEDQPDAEVWRALAGTLVAEALLVVPLAARSRVLGAMTLGRGPSHPFSPADRSLAVALAERAALAIDNAHKHAEAIEARRLRDEVLAVVAHDLRNPLNTILLHAASLARAAGGGAEESAAIRRAASRANRLIQDLLLTAMAEGGRVPLDREECEVADLVEEVVSEHRPIAEQGGLSLEAQIDPNIGVAFLDRHRVLQVLSNLVGNALKFTPGGGRVSVEARRIHERLELRVRDTGVGMTQEELAHVFDRFWQSARARRAGSGLGLAIAKGIAEAHGGAIDVSSRVGEGTEFAVLLPMHPFTEG